MSENNNTEFLGEETDFETPEHTLQTLQRLWRSVGDQHRRLAVVLISVILYTALSDRARAAPTS
ncbi:MAG: hypothetical protein ACLTNO_04900 [Blautia sp.]